MSNPHTRRAEILLSGMLLAGMLVLGMLILPPATDAAEGFVPLADFPSGGPLATLYAPPGDPKDLSNFLGTLFLAALSIGAILAVLRIAYAGYMYMVSDLWTNKEKAKEILGQTVLGLLLLLAVWTILNQINPDILSLRIGAAGSTNTTSSTQEPNTTNFSFPGGASGSEGKTYYMAPAYKNWCYETRRTYICFQNNNYSEESCRNAEKRAREGGREGERDDSDFVSGCKLLGS